jgi:hypothetical protein
MLLNLPLKLNKPNKAVQATSLRSVPDLRRYLKMNDQEQFSALMIGNEFGLVEKNEIIQLADEKITAIPKPPYWLIELSTEAKSSEFLRVESDEVIRSVLGRAYRKWKNGELSDPQFRACLRNIWNIKGVHSDWYPTLAWVEDDLSLIEDGVFSRDGHIEGICNELEKIMR